MQGEQEPDVPFTQVRNDTQGELRVEDRIVLDKLTPRAWGHPNRDTMQEMDELVWNRDESRLN